MKESSQPATSLPKLWELFLKVLGEELSGRFDFEENGSKWSLVSEGGDLYLLDLGLDAFDSFDADLVREKPRRLLKMLIERLDNLGEFSCDFGSGASDSEGSEERFGPVDFQTLVDGWIHKKELPPEEEQEEEIQPTRVRMDILLMFRRKIAEGLSESPLEIEENDHRAQLVEALATMGSMNHFERLEIGERFSSEDLAKAFEMKARLVHPDHATNLGLNTQEEALELLFELVTESYLVLNDPNRLRDYLADFGSLHMVSEISEESREQEIREQLDHRFDLAKRAFERGDFHSTSTLMTEILKSESRPEYWALLAEVQAKNHLWVEKAIESYRMAIELAPQEISYLFRLAEICEANGREEIALQYYHKVLEKDSTHPAASEAIANLGGSGSSRTGSGAIPKPFTKSMGLMDWVLGILGLQRK